MNWQFDNCRGHKRSLSLRAVGRLQDEDHSRLETHLANCDACRAKLGELRALVAGLDQLGRRLPEIEAPVSLRRRWMTAVRSTARPGSSFAPGRLISRRLVWGSLAAMWVMVLFFRFTAPDTARSTSFADASPVSLREVLLALKVDDPGNIASAGAKEPARNPAPPSGALPPRSRAPEAIRGLEPEAA